LKQQQHDYEFHCSIQWWLSTCRWIALAEEDPME